MCGGHCCLPPCLNYHRHWTSADASRFPQPNYRSYIELDLGGLLQRAGLRPARKELRSVTKALSFVKPHAAS